MPTISFHTACVKWKADKKNYVEEIFGVFSEFTVKLNALFYKIMTFSLIGQVDFVIFLFLLYQPQKVDTSIFGMKHSRAG